LITFTTPECLSKLNPADPSHSIIKELIDRSVQESKLSKHHWIPEQDGFFILVQPEDLEITLDELHPGETLRTIPYEGVHYKDGHYIAVTLLNNQASLVWVINSVGLPDDFRKILEDNMVSSVD
jgi:hypothetical protein